MSKKTLIKILLSLGVLLIICSMGIAGYYIIEASRADKYALEVVNEFEGRLERIEESAVSSEPLDENTDSNIDEEDAEDTYIPSFMIEGDEYIGLIEIPSLDIKLPVMSDWDEHKLKKAPCKYSGSYDSDDLVICGHNYRGRKQFNPLHNISIDDDVYFTSSEGRVMHYTVLRTEVLEADAIQYMNTKTDWDLTLYTCTSSGSKRFTVRCRKN